MQYAEGGTMEKMITEQNGVHFQEPLVLNYFTQVFHILLKLKLSFKNLDLNCVKSHALETNCP